MPYPASPPDPPAIVSPRLPVSSELSASPRLSQDVVSPAHPAVSASPLPPALPRAKRVPATAKPESTPPELAPTRLTTFVKESAKPRASLLGPAVTLGTQSGSSSPSQVSPDFFSPDVAMPPPKPGASPDLSDGAFVSDFVHGLTEENRPAAVSATRRSYNLQLVRPGNARGQAAESLSKLQGLRRTPVGQSDRPINPQLVITQVGGSPLAPGVPPLPSQPDSFQDLPDNSQPGTNPAIDEITPPPPTLETADLDREPHTIPSDELPKLDAAPGTTTTGGKPPTPTKPIATGPVPDVIELTVIARFLPLKAMW
jgi:hypothetical protein